MKIAIPTRENHVDGHFGQCEFYTIFTVNETNTVEKKEYLPSLEGCGCKSNIASVLKNEGVDIMLAGNMGQGALNVLNNQGINVIRGCSGNIDQLVEDFLKGIIKDSGESCAHHEHHQGHDHEHQH